MFSFAISCILMKVGPLKSSRNTLLNRFWITLLPPLSFLLLVYTTLMPIKVCPHHFCNGKHYSHCVLVKTRLCVIILCMWGVCHSKPLNSININIVLLYLLILSVLFMESVDECSYLAAPNVYISTKLDFQALCVLLMQCFASPCTARVSKSPVAPSTSSRV